MTSSFPPTTASVLSRTAIFRLAAILTAVAALFAFLPPPCGAQEIELAVTRGDFCFMYFRDPADPEKLTPFARYMYEDPAYGDIRGIYRVKFAKPEKDEDPVLMITGWPEGFNAYRFSVEMERANVPSTVPLSGDTAAGLLKVSRSGGMVEMAQELTDNATGRRFEFVILITKDKDEIIRSIRIPKTYIAWQWRFSDKLGFLAPMWKEGREARAQKERERQEESGIAPAPDPSTHSTDE